MNSLLLGMALAQPEIKDQAAKEFNKADHELNMVYQEVKKFIKDERAMLELARAQRAWLVFRDTEAEFRAGLSSGGGSAYAADHLANLSEMTRKRTDELKALLLMVK